MISFFRRFRQKLLQQNKFTKYLMYAIGEILLVVIGILIALQVNNWNENRKLIEEERLVINSLQGEVKSNKPLVSDCLEETIYQMQLTDSLQAFLGPEYASLEKTQLYELIGATGYAGRCVINTDILNELRSSGKLNLIRNSELRQAISQWTTAFENLRSEENEWNREFSTQYLPYTYKWVSWDDIDYYFNIADTAQSSSAGHYQPSFTPSKFEYDANKMLQQFEYANLLDVHLWRMARVRERIEKLKEKTEALDTLLRD